MPNGEMWDVPAEMFAKHRANAIAIESSDEIEIRNKIYEEEYKNAMNDNELLTEWAREKFKWDDVELYAFKAVPPPSLTREHKREAWKNGDMTVVNKP